MRGPGPYLLILPIVLSSCLTPQTQIELDQARQKVADLQAQVDKAEADQATNTAYLKELLAVAEKKLLTTEAKANDERVENGAAAVEQSANALSPLLGLFLPGATLALGAIGLGAGAIRKKKAAKRKAAEAAAGGK